MLMNSFSYRSDLPFKSQYWSIFLFNHVYCLYKRSSHNESATNTVTRCLFCSHQYNDYIYIYISEELQWEKGTVKNLPISGLIRPTLGNSSDYHLLLWAKN